MLQRRLRPPDLSFSAARLEMELVVFTWSVTFTLDSRDKLKAIEECGTICKLERKQKEKRKKKELD
jgi:hypothetical protein